MYGLVAAWVNKIITREYEIPSSLEHSKFYLLNYGYKNKIWECSMSAAMLSPCSYG